MSDKAKWFAAYLGIGTVPILLHVLPPLSPDIIPGHAVTNFLIFAPYVGLTLIAILGWQINQTRIFWSTLLLLAFYYYLLHLELFTFTPSGRVHTLQIASVAYPAALCVIFLLKESRLWSDQSLARLLLASFPLFLFICLFSWEPDLYQKLFFWHPYAPAQSADIPNLAWISVSLFLTIVYYLYDPRAKPFLGALAAAQWPFFFCLKITLSSAALSGKPSPVTTVILAFSAMTLILLHAILRMYWRKVYMDPLTAIPNRQAMDERLHTLSGRFALAMVDIDHFKKFNDTYGHAEGDNVLRMVAQQLQESLGDRVYRYGGEEFCAIFENQDAENAGQWMERARATLEKRKFVLRGSRRPKSEGLKLPFQKEEHRGKKVHITISVGVSSSGKAGRSCEEVLKHADHALYEAKEKGRNRVVSEGK